MCKTKGPSNYLNICMEMNTVDFLQTNVFYVYHVVIYQYFEFPVCKYFGNNPHLKETTCQI